MNLPRILLASIVALSSTLAHAQLFPATKDPSKPAAGSGSATLVAPALPMPPPVPTAPAIPTHAATNVFGSQLFTGQFSQSSFSGFNPNHVVAVGDRITVRVWGAATLEATLTVDPQGNVFLPQVGPVGVQGVRNADLNAHVTAQTARVFKGNVGVYATLESAQPVRVFVSGFVRQPGMYAGLSSDSVLYFLDKAGGIDPARGSYLRIDLLRAGRSLGSINLYDFLLGGQVLPLQLQDGDTLVAQPRQFSVQVSGEVFNPFVFEFAQDRFTAKTLFEYARPNASATHFGVARKVGAERRSEYHPLTEAARVEIQNGDEVTVTADKYPGTILVRIDGAHLGERSVVLPYGSTLQDLMPKLKPAPQANMKALQLFRRSVVQRQKESLEASLRSLESSVLSARSATNEEAQLRGREAELALQFIDRARKIEPKGQVVIAGVAGAQKTLLEDGDVIRIPETSNLVYVSGEVLFPNAVVHTPGLSANDYITRVGGYSQNADASRVVVMAPDGSVSMQGESRLQPGDEVMVLPKVDTKNIEVTRGITQILYQIAVAAKVAFGL
jgi:protein involved in polysaccharide export with SLBB domain